MDQETVDHRFGVCNQEFVDRLKLARTFKNRAKRIYFKLSLANYSWRWSEECVLLVFLCKKNKKRVVKDMDFFCISEGF